MLRSVAAGNIVKDRLLEGELAARPGEPRAWRVNYSPIFHEDGSVRAISTASIEITNQKKAESALIQSEKLAAVGRLASSISHEINNPLEAITNLLYLIAMHEDLPVELRGYVHMAQSELSRVSQIATQTLRFYRQAVAPTLVTAEELVGAVVRLYTGRLANSNIKVDARYASQTRILCFENDIRQVLNNLIANAIDAMRTGGRLILRAHDCTRAGCHGVRIAIADTGTGMSPTVLARAFEPFFTTKDLNGTGLGLWISAGIVERHQGRLRVRSTDDPRRHGTTFTLFLPRKES
jgi:signal transduction histidine kinase